MGVFLPANMPFLRGSTAAFHTANFRYAFYVVERLAVCISNVRNLKDHLSSRSPGISLETCDVTASYQSNLSELLACLELLAVQWDDYADSVHNIDVSQAYHAPIEPQIGRRGRPCLVISQDQLEYLCSLSFTWTEMLHCCMCLV